MPTVENRSRFVVSVKNNATLTKEFPYEKTAAASQYFALLTGQGLKPRIRRTDDAFLIRIRQKGFKELNATFTSAKEAEAFINTVEAERARGLFIDYTQATKTPFSELVARYLREESPKHKSFEMEAYKLNGMLEDAGCARVDLQALIQADPRLARAKQRKPTGARVRESGDTLHWLNKPFAFVEPTDFEDYIKERLEVVAPATVDRELDLLSAICRIAINTWRIAVAKSPMDGVRRPRYFNERDRRLKSGEYDKLMDAARHEDRERGIAACLAALVADAKQNAAGMATVYGRKNLIKTARAASAADAEQAYQHVPLIETFIQFQLMTGARRGETLNLTWDHINLDEKTAYLPETKNGRPRKLSLRAALIDLLRQLPQSDKRAPVFPLSTDALRKAWARVCVAGGLDDLHIHDLRHEAISLVAETGCFSLVDLQAFSGHRDVRMLLRYAHLCARQLAERLDAAFDGGTVHRGRKRLLAGATLTLAEVVAASSTSSTAETAALAPVTPENDEAPSTVAVAEPAALGANVIRFPGRRVA